MVVATASKNRPKLAKRPERKPPKTKCLPLPTKRARKSLARVVDGVADAAAVVVAIGKVARKRP